MRPEPTACASAARRAEKVSGENMRGVPGGKAKLPVPLRRGDPEQADSQASEYATGRPEPSWRAAIESSAPSLPPSIRMHSQPHLSISPNLHPPFASPARFGSLRARSSSPCPPSVTDALPPSLSGRVPSECSLPTAAPRLRTSPCSTSGVVGRGLADAYPAFARVRLDAFTGRRKCGW